MKQVFKTVVLLVLLLALPFAVHAENTEADRGGNSMGIRYISFGSGEKTMVVVPGLSIGYVTDSAAAIEAAFSGFTQEYTVYLFDIRDDVPEDYTISRMGEDLVAVIQELGLKNIYLYGCSMGGMQSIYIAGHYPELVEKVAVAASACELNETARTVVSNWIQLAQAGARQELMADMGQRIYSKAFYDANKEAFAAMADGLTEETLTRFVRTASAIPSMDLTAEAAAIQCPILILGSAGDQVLTGQASARIAEITGGEFFLYSEAYPHAVYDEAPDLRDRVSAFFG